MFASPHCPTLVRRSARAMEDRKRKVSLDKETPSKKKINASNVEVQEGIFRSKKNPEIRCQGCLEDQPNQLAHIDPPFGCLSQD